MARRSIKFIPDWECVERYLAKDNEDGIKLAILEAEKIFLKIINKKGYKVKTLEQKISQAVKEISNPESFVRARSIALGIENIINFDPGDVYSGEDMARVYREAIEELIYGEVSGTKLGSLKYKFWPFYYYILLNQKKIFRILLWITLIVVLTLFIADTETGRILFNYFVDKIHFILRLLLVILLIIFAIVFIVILSIVILESRGRRHTAVKK